MSAAFADVAEQLSSSASSSFISNEPRSAGRSPSGYQQPGSPFLSGSAPSHGNGAGATGGISNANVNISAGAGSASAAAGTTSTSRPLEKAEANGMTPKRFVDPKDENGVRGAAPAATRAAAGAGASAATRTASPAKPVRPTTEKPQQLPKTATAIAWAESVALTYYTCTFCEKVATDPVQVLPENGLACRRCARGRGPAVTVHELPASIVSAIRDTVERGGGLAVLTEMSSVEAGFDPPNLVAKRRFLHVKRPDSGPAGSGVNSVTEDGAVSSPMMRDTASAGGSERTAQTQQLIDQVVEAETTERKDITTQEAAARTALERRRRNTSASRTTDGGLTSRQLKVEADRKYENGEYTAALEFYSKAIKQQPHDRLTQLKFLYGNRSAAHFMAQRYEECMTDCLEVVKLDPANTKMTSRAARAAATMGDLARAVSILESTPPERLSESMQGELTKYRSGLDLYQRAEKAFGTPDGDERYRMLVAQFSDTVPLRVRYAESLVKQKQYMRAVETLEVVSVTSRTPRLAKIMAECLYLSGFEHFERARKCLKEMAQLDDECAALLRLIDIVDDGKQKGNNAFAQKNFASAVEQYSSAIQHASGNDQILRILFCNRAAANKELGRYKEGVEDCTKAIAIDEDFFKAYARRARCHLHLGDNFAAVNDFKRALQYDSSDSELTKELRQAESNLAKEAEREKDYYFQLGVTRTATDREIKAKYRELSLRWHPDKCIGMSAEEKERAEHKFKIISEAHATLIDPTKRREYDLKSDRERLTRPGGFGGFSSTYNGDYFRGGNRHRSGPGGFW